MTGKFQRLFITGVILLGFSSQAISKVIEKSSDHLLVQNSGGKVIYQDITRVDGKEFRSVNWAKTEDAEARYLAKKINEVRVKHAPTGAMSSARVPAAIVGSVARQTVLKNLLTKAVAGGRAVAGIGSGPVGWALTAATAYQLVAPTLEENGYRWDSSKSNFVTDKEYKFCLMHRQWKGDNYKDVEIECIGVGVHSYNLYRRNWEQMKPHMDSMCQRNWQTLLPSYKPEYGYRFGYSAPHGCTAVSNTDNGRTAGTFEMSKVSDAVITQSEFNRIIGPKADADPTRYVNAIAKDDGTVPDVTVSPNVTVPNGTVVTIGPYTDSNGQPQQVTVTFRTANGETTVSVNVTPRPDLTPNSSAAPSASPNTSGQSSPSGSPNSSGQSSSQTNTQTDGQTNTQTGSQTSPQTGGQTGNQSNPKQDGEPEKKDEDKTKDGSFLCDLFPDILACDKQPEPEEPDLQIPEETINLNFTPDDTFAENGQCPAPVTFEALGSTYAISLQPACDLAALMRPFIIAMAWLVASFFVVRVVRENA